MLFAETETCARRERRQSAVRLFDILGSRVRCILRIDFFDKINITSSYEGTIGMELVSPKLNNAVLNNVR